MSSFVAGLLNSGDGAIVAAALQLAQLLMAKLPDVFRVHFVKEGVVHAIDKLAASAPVKVCIALLRSAYLTHCKRMLPPATWFKWIANVTASPTTRESFLDHSRIYCSRDAG